MTQHHTPRQDNSDLNPDQSLDFDWSMSQVQKIGVNFGFLAQLAMGVKLPFLGAAYLFKTKGLLKYAAAPSAAAFILFIGIFWGVYQYWIADLSWLWWVLATLANAIGSVFLASILYMPVAGSFLEAMIEKVELKERGLLFHNPPQPKSSLKKTMKAIIQSMTHMVFFMGLSILIAVVSNCVPVVGHVAALWATVILVIWGISADFICSMRMWGIGDKLGFMFRRSGLFLGFSLVIWPLLAIPFLLPFIIGPCIVGMTLVFCWMERSGALKAADGRL